MSVKQQDIPENAEEIIRQLRDYNAGEANLTLKQFDRILMLAQTLTKQLDEVIDTTHASKDGLQSIKSRLEAELSIGPSEMGEATNVNALYGNRFGLFNESGEEAHVDDEYSVSDYNYNFS